MGKYSSGSDSNYYSRFLVPTLKLLPALLHCCPHCCTVASTAALLPAPLHCSQHCCQSFCQCCCTVASTAALLPTLLPALLPALLHCCPHRCTVVNTVASASASAADCCQYCCQRFCQRCCTVASIVACACMALFITPRHSRGQKLSSARGTVIASHRNYKRMRWPESENYLRGRLRRNDYITELRINGCATTAQHRTEAYFSHGDNNKNTHRLIPR